MNDICPYQKKKKCHWAEGKICVRGHSSLKECEESKYGITKPCDDRFISGNKKEVEK